jgi:hypothetical protein
MTTISDNFAAEVGLRPMASGRDAEFSEMLDEFRGADETHVCEGSFVVAWEGYGPFYDLISKMKAGEPALFSRKYCGTLSTYFGANHCQSHLMWKLTGPKGTRVIAPRVIAFRTWDAVRSLV